MKKNSAKHIEDLASRFETALGRPLMRLREASSLSGLGATTLRQAIAQGDLMASRTCGNGLILIRCYELARWIASCEMHSLPQSKADKVTDEAQSQLSE